MLSKDQLFTFYHAYLDFGRSRLTNIDSLLRTRLTSSERFICTTDVLINQYVPNFFGRPAVEVSRWLKTPCV